MNPFRNFPLPLLLLIPLLCLSGCATSESDADDIADTAVKGLMGQGTLSNERVMKSDLGSGQAFGNDFQ